MNLNKFYRRKISVSDVIDCADYSMMMTLISLPNFHIYYFFWWRWEYSWFRTVCYLDNGPKIIDGKEVFPDFVNENGLDILCSGDVFMDVYDDLDERYPNFTKDQLIDALNYYMDNDDYIEF